ncbi:MAG: dephospho-CoA kinase [Eubacteriales bacterium]
MLVIGLTGGSGAGKSTVARMLADYGGTVCDADALYATMTCVSSAVTKALADTFGPSVLAPDGALNRAALAAIVFPDPDQLRLLNQTVHPFVLAEMAERMKESQKAGKPYLVLDAPQLFESGADRMCSLTVAVLAPRGIRTARITARDGISTEAAERRMNAQLPDDFFRERCDFVLENNGDAASLRAACDTLMLRFGFLRERGTV